MPGRRLSKMAETPRPFQCALGSRWARRLAAHQAASLIPAKRLTLQTVWQTTARRAAEMVRWGQTSFQNSARLLPNRENLRKKTRRPQVTGRSDLRHRPHGYPSNGWIDAGMATIGIWITPCARMRLPAKPMHRASGSRRGTRRVQSAVACAAFRPLPSAFGAADRRAAARCQPQAPANLPA